MKTPRELLLERHRSMDGKLDAIRRKAVATVAQESRKAPSSTKTTSWREFFVSMRWHLAGLGAAWLLVTLLNTNDSAGIAAKVAQENSPAPQQFLTALRENRRQLRELMEIPATESAPLPGIIPQRRGERPSETAMA